MNADQENLEKMKEFALKAFENSTGKDRGILEDGIYKDATILTGAYTVDNQMRALNAIQAYTGCIMALQVYAVK